MIIISKYFLITRHITCLELLEVPSSKNNSMTPLEIKSSSRACMLKCVSLLYYWITTWPQQTLCHHAEEKKKASRSQLRCTVGSQECDLHTHTSGKHTHTHTHMHTHRLTLTLWRQAFMCGCKNKKKSQTGSHFFDTHCGFMCSGTCSGTLTDTF